MSHILAVRPGALGDALLAFPALALIRDKMPHTRITFVSRSDVLALAQSSGLADEVSTYDDPLWMRLFSDTDERDGPLVEMSRTLTGAVLWLGTAGGLVESKLRALGVPVVARGHARPLPDDTSHAALVLAQALTGIGIPAPASVSELLDVMPPLRPSERDVVEAWRILAAASVAPKRLVALHPGSGGTAKRWPASRFAALARWLIAEGATPVVIAGPADDDVLGTLLGSVGAADRMIVVRGASIGALVEILRTCVLYVGNDSGITHLAALVGIPVVALFGPSNPALWAPPGRRVHIIRATLDDLRNLSVEDVHSAISLLGYRDQR